MNFYDNYYTVGTKVKAKAARQEYFSAVIEYYYTGNEPAFKHEAAEIAFTGVRFSLDRSRRNAANRTKTKAEGNANESGTNEEGIYESSDEDVFLSSSLHSSIEEPMEESSFPIVCLGELNRVLGTTYCSLPPSAARTLARFEGVYTPEEVRTMVEYKRADWQDTRFKRNLTPNTLFSVEHFEQYMNQSKQHAKEASEYDIYD